MGKHLTPSHSNLKLTPLALYGRKRNCLRMDWWNEGCSYISTGRTPAHLQGHSPFWQVCRGIHWNNPLPLVKRRLKRKGCLECKDNELTNQYWDFGNSQSLWFNFVTYSEKFIFSTPKCFCSLKKPLNITMEHSMRIIKWEGSFACCFIPLLFNLHGKGGISDYLQ